MPIELDSTEVIAYMVHKWSNGNQYELKYKEIRDICEYVENIKSNVLVTFDRISIDAFRCSFPKNVVMMDDHLVINNLSSIKNKIERLMPSEDIIKLIDQYYLIKDEENNNIAIR